MSIYRKKAREWASKYSIWTRKLTVMFWPNTPPPGPWTCQTFSRPVSIYDDPGAKGLKLLLERLHTQRALCSASAPALEGVLYKGQQVVELTHILDPMNFKTQISLKLGFDKISYQQNMKCGNSSGKVCDRITYVQEESGFNYCLYSVCNSLLK